MVKRGVYIHVEWLEISHSDSTNAQIMQGSALRLILCMPKLCVESCANSCANTVTSPLLYFCGI